MAPFVSQRTPLRFLGAVIAIGVVILAVACALPHDRYLRYQNLTDPAVVKSSWIYERIHFDPTPIDIAFVGTSHTVFGIDSQVVEHACLDAGETRCHTVNLGLEHLGRNVHWLIARELLASRTPRLLVIEVQETEFRALHPAFGSLAEPGDIISAPIFINTSFVTDLVHLPLRQMTLFVHTLAPRLFGEHEAFISSLYRGSHWDDTFASLGSPQHPIASPTPRTRGATTAELERERIQSAAADENNIKLPAVLRPFEYRANLIYLDKLMTLAREKNVEVRFLYMPSFAVTAPPRFSALYASFAPSWQVPDTILSQPALWSDIGHLNYDGAVTLSTWLGARIAEDAANAPKGPPVTQAGTR